MAHIPMRIGGGGRGGHQHHIPRGHHPMPGGHGSMGGASNHILMGQYGHPPSSMSGVIMPVPVGQSSQHLPHIHTHSPGQPIQATHSPSHMGHHMGVDTGGGGAPAGPGPAGGAGHSPGYHTHHHHHHHSVPPPGQQYVGPPPHTHATATIQQHAGVMDCQHGGVAANGSMMVGPSSVSAVNGGSSHNNSISSTASPSNQHAAAAREKTPMCLVNELARFNKIDHQYRLTDESGPAHKKNFTVCLKLGDKEEYTASGLSIKKAQHAAATSALEKTEFKHPTPKVKCNKSVHMTPTVELNAVAMKRGEPAVYNVVEVVKNVFEVVKNSEQSYRSRTPGSGRPGLCRAHLRVGTREFTGEGSTPQAAKHDAASKALAVLKELPVPDNKSKQESTPTASLIPGVEYDDLKSPISLVHEIALKRNCTVHFEVVRETGPPHMRVFFTRCSVGDLMCEGEGNGKKPSKKKAAEMMLEKLKQLPPIASSYVPKPKKQTNNKKKSRNLIKVEQDAGTDLSQTINPISRLIQIQQAKKEKEPVYTLVAEKGQPRLREFFIQVTVGDKTAVGSGPNKKLAKRAAAETLLQEIGYSRSTPLPAKPALKSHGESSDKSKKLTFVPDVAARGEDQGGPRSSGRQLVPGLIYIQDEKGKSRKKERSEMKTQAAAIAKELLDGGTSPTADLLANKKSGDQRLAEKKAGNDKKVTNGSAHQLPTSGQGVSSKEQLAYLSQVLGFTVAYNDFPKEGEYLSLVSLSTKPPQVSHGSGATLEASHNNAAHAALQTLASVGLDGITSNGIKKGKDTSGSSIGTGAKSTINGNT